MSVAMLLRDKVFGDRTVVMTSATLELGGTFDAVAGTIGLRGEGAPDVAGPRRRQPVRLPASRRIAYVAEHLPAPGRDGLARRDPRRDRGAGPGRRRPHPRAVLLDARRRGGRPRRCASGSAPTSTSSARARTRSRRWCASSPATPRTCLFGTLSLWQGVDVPGSACQLVLIDRIPFPRPDDPLASARSQAIARMGGNGFMAVSATHAALRLAQGAGRLIRRGDDRGVVAFLDSRMMTARYAGFLQRSLPPFWPTTDRAMVLAALEAAGRDRGRAAAGARAGAARADRRRRRRGGRRRRRGRWPPPRPLRPRRAPR